MAEGILRGILGVAVLLGIKPNPKLLSTERAKRPTVIDWGWQRSRGKKVSLKGS